MGSYSSKTKEETPEERKESLRREYGVLLPPSFVNGDRLPISGQPALIANQAVTPSLLDYLWATNSGSRLLDDHFQPGICIHLTTVKGGTLLVSLNSPIPLQKEANLANEATSEPIGPFFSSSSDLIIGNSRRNLQALPSIFWARYSLSPALSVEVLAPTTHNPSMQISAKVGTTLGLKARFTNDVSSCGWLEGKYAAFYPTVGHHGLNLILSSWMSTDGLQQLCRNLNSGRKMAAAAASPTLHLQGGIEYQESMIAAQVEIPCSREPLASNCLPKLDTMVSFNLNHEPSDFSTPNLGAESAPPLWLTIKQQKKYLTSSSSQTSASWILNLSQVLTFDRIVLNPIEDRAPKIRQTLGWVVQVERDTATNESTWSAAVTFQWNRAIACKAALFDNGHSLVYGAILKHWEQPRVTLSILQSFDFPTRRHAFAGFGLELEAAPSKHVEGGEGWAFEYPEQANVSHITAPPTRIQIPREHKS